MVTEKVVYTDGKLRRMGTKRLDEQQRKQHRELRDRRRNRHNG